MLGSIFPHVFEHNVPRVHTSGSIYNAVVLLEEVLLVNDRRDRQRVARGADASGLVNEISDGVVDPFEWQLPV